MRLLWRIAVLCGWLGLSFSWAQEPLEGEEPVRPPLPPELQEVLPTRTAEDWDAMREGTLVPGASLMGSDALEELFSESTERIFPDPELVELLDGTGGNAAWQDELMDSQAEVYFGQTPQAFLVDPQELLEKQERAKLVRVLEKHAQSSVIDIYLYLFTGKQELPPAESCYAVVRNHFGAQRDVAVVFAYRGLPGRTEMAFSRRIHRGVNEKEIREVKRRVRESAGEHAKPGAQILGLIKALSREVFAFEGQLPPRMEAMLSVTAVKDDSAAEAKKAAKIQLFVTVAGWLVLLTITFFVWRWWVRRRVYLFPATMGEPTMGAPYGAQVSTIMSYTSATYPPSRQRKETKDVV